MHLYMIRHGESHVNLQDWDEGNLDVGLTELGRRQAAALAAWLPSELPHIDGFYASTMNRARETAEILVDACGCPIRFDDRLREIGDNRADHSPWPKDQLPREYADFWSTERPFSSIFPTVEGGETLMHFRTRIGQFIEEMVAQHRDEVVVAVCHSGVIEMTFDHIFNIGPWRRCEVWSDNTGITCFQYVAHPGRETWRLRYHNRVDHLRGRGT
jgi:broad specificity phosphatase PhoE